MKDHTYFHDIVTLYACSFGSASQLVVCNIFLEKRHLKTYFCNTFIKQLNLQARARSYQNALPRLWYESSIQHQYEKEVVTYNFCETF